MCFSLSSWSVLFSRHWQEAEEGTQERGTKKVEEGRTQVEEQVEEGRTQIEQEAQEVQKQVEEKVGEGQ